MYVFIRFSRTQQLLLMLWRLVSARKLVAKILQVAVVYD